MFNDTPHMFTILTALCLATVDGQNWWPFRWQGPRGDYLHRDTFSQQRDEYFGWVLLLNIPSEHIWRNEWLDVGWVHGNCWSVRADFPLCRRRAYIRHICFRHHGIHVLYSFREGSNQSINDYALLRVILTTCLTLSVRRIPRALWCIRTFWQRATLIWRLKKRSKFHPNLAQTGISDRSAHESRKCEEIFKTNMNGSYFKWHQKL